MVCDSLRHRVFLFGGQDFTHFFVYGDLWVLDLDTGTWTQLDVPGPPIARAFSSMCYDAANDRMILWGGRTEFYMLGDNRADSCDSRYWGPIKGSSIIGKVVLVWWHDDHPDFRRF